MWRRARKKEDRTRSVALVCTGVGSAALLAALLLGGRWGAVCFGALAAWLPVALMALGGQPGRRGFPLALVSLALLLQGGVWGLLALKGQLLEVPWVAGVPLAVVVFLGAFWLVPLGVISVAHGLFFETPEETGRVLERLRSLREDQEDREDRQVGEAD